MKKAILLLFCAILLLCVVLDVSIFCALGAGLVMFFFYSLKKGFSVEETWRMCLSGIKNVRKILITFVLIGVLTALWRASGTIPVIIAGSAALMRSSAFLLLVFLINCAVSVLTGTSFGTAATMGVICAAMAAAMEIPAALVGGAILSGAYFGDRCSPVSTSALLVAELTSTNIFKNIRAMLKTAAVPFFLSCAAYLLMGLRIPCGRTSLDMGALFEQEFRLHWAAWLPALAILVLSLFRVNVRATMLVSIAAAVLVCLLIQGVSWGELIRFAIFGYTARQEELAVMLNGGGVVSLVKVAAIVCISSAYSGIFQETGILDEVQEEIVRLSGRITPYGAILLTALLTGVAACNQTLTILLTHQLCRHMQPDRQALAISLEDTAVILAPLIPWSIACAVPLASANAPAGSILYAVFLYALPAWRLFLAFLEKRRGGAAAQEKNM